MYSAARKILLTGLGLAVVTKEKAEKLVSEWVREGELSKEEGRELLDTWKRRIDDEREEISQRIQKEVSKILSHSGMVPSHEFDELRKRVVALEEKVTELSSRESGQ